MDFNDLLKDTQRLLEVAGTLDQDHQAAILRSVRALLFCATTQKAHGAFIWVDGDSLLCIDGINATHLDVLVLLRTAHDSFLESFQQDAATATQNGEVH